MAPDILVAMDDSETAETALRHALAVYPDATVTVLTVVGEPSSMFGEATAIALADEPRTSAQEHAEPVLDRARAIADESDRRIDTEVGTGHPAQTILARAGEFDIVVIGSHDGSLVDRLLVGDIAQTVVQESPVPVTVVH